MRKIILICLFALVGVTGFSQVIVNRAGASNTVSDARWQAQLNAFLPRYQDTTAANLQKGIDSCGAVIYTRSPQAKWTRYCNPKRWVREVDVENISSILDSAGVNISVLDSNTFVICNGAGVCDTFNTDFNYNTIQFITDSSIQYCSVDTVNGGVVSICDTLVVGDLGSPLIYQNWVRQHTNIIEFGSNSQYTSPGLFLGHNTYTNTGYYTMNWHGYTIYDAPNQFWQQQSFQNGGGVASFLSSGNSVFGHPNSSRLMIGYTADTSNRTPFIDGVVGSSIGYYLGTNGVQQHGSYGTYVDDNRAKTSMILLHQYDTTNADAVTIIGAQSLGGTTPVLNGDLNNYKIATFSNNGNIRFYGYDSATRNDGVLTKSLGTDAFGNVILGRSFTIAYDSLFQTSDTSFALQRNNLTRDTVVVAWAAGDKNQIHVESWSNLTIVNNTIDSAQLKITGVTEGTYTNATIRVNDRGQLTYAANGSIGNLNDFRYLPFQVSVTTNAPSVGATYFLMPSDYATKKIFLYREGRQQFDTTNGVTSYQYLQHLDTIFLTTAVLDSERLAIYAYPDSNWTVDNLPAASGYDPDAQAYFTAEGITNSTDKTNINNLYVALKASTNPFTKIKRILLGYNSGLVDGKTATTLTASNPPTIGATGYTLNGTNNYIDLGITASSLSNNEAHFFYQKTSSNGLVIVGAVSAGVGTRIFPGDVANNLFVRISGGSSDVNLGASSTAQRLAIWRNSVSGNRNVYRNGLVVNNAPLTAGTPPALNLFFGCSNEATTPTYYVNGNYGIYLLADGLTDAEALQIDAAIGNFITATGRN